MKLTVWIMPPSGPDTLRHSADASPDLADRPLYKLAVPANDEETFEELWDKIQKRFDRDYRQRNGMQATEFDKLQDMQGGEISLQDPILDLFDGSRSHAELQLKLQLKWIDRETSILPGSTLRPANYRKRRLSDLSEHEQLALKRIRLEETVNRAVPSREPSDPVASKSHAAPPPAPPLTPATLDKDGFKVPPRPEVRFRGRPANPPLRPAVLVESSQAAGSPRLRPPGASVTPASAAAAAASHLPPSHQVPANDQTGRKTTTPATPVSNREAERRADAPLHGPNSHPFKARSTASKIASELPAEQDPIEDESDDPDEYALAGVDDEDMLNALSRSSQSVESAGSGDRRYPQQSPISTAGTSKPRRVHATKPSSSQYSPMSESQYTPHASTPASSKRVTWTAEEDALIQLGLRRGYFAPQILEELLLPTYDRTLAALRTRIQRLKRMDTRPASSKTPAGSKSSVAGASGRAAAVARADVRQHEVADDPSNISASARLEPHKAQQASLNRPGGDGRQMKLNWSRDKGKQSAYPYRASPEQTENTMHRTMPLLSEQNASQGASDIQNTAHHESTVREGPQRAIKHARSDSTTHRRPTLGITLSQPFVPDDTESLLVSPTKSDNYRADNQLTQEFESSLFEREDAQISRRTTNGEQGGRQSPKLTTDHANEARAAATENGVDTDQETGNGEHRSKRRPETPSSAEQGKDESPSRSKGSVAKRVRRRASTAVAKKSYLENSPGKSPPVPSDPAMEAEVEDTIELHSSNKMSNGPSTAPLGRAPPERHRTSKASSSETTNSNTDSEGQIYSKAARPGQLKPPPTSNGSASRLLAARKQLRGQRASGAAMQSRSPADQSEGSGQATQVAPKRRLDHAHFSTNEHAEAGSGATPGSGRSAVAVFNANDATPELEYTERIENTVNGVHDQLASAIQPKPTATPATLHTSLQPQKRSAVPTQKRDLFNGLTDEQKLRFARQQGRPEETEQSLKEMNFRMAFSNAVLNNDDETIKTLQLMEARETIAQRRSVAASSSRSWLPNYVQGKVSSPQEDDEFINEDIVRKEPLAVAETDAPNNESEESDADHGRAEGKDPTAHDHESVDQDLRLSDGVDEDEESDSASSESDSSGSEPGHSRRKVSSGQPADQQIDVSRSQGSGAPPAGIKATGQAQTTTMASETQGPNALVDIAKLAIQMVPDGSASRDEEKTSASAASDDADSPDSGREENTEIRGSAVGNENEVSSDHDSSSDDNEEDEDDDDVEEAEEDEENDVVPVKGESSVKQQQEDGDVDEDEDEDESEGDDDDDEEDDDDDDDSDDDEEESESDNVDHEVAQPPEPNGATAANGVAPTANSAEVTSQSDDDASDSSSDSGDASNSEDASDDESGSEDSSSSQRSSPANVSSPPPSQPPLPTPKTTGSSITAISSRNPPGTMSSPVPRSRQQSSRQPVSSSQPVRGRRAQPHIPDPPQRSLPPRGPVTSNPFENDEDDSDDGISDGDSSDAE